MTVRTTVLALVLTLLVGASVGSAAGRYTDRLFRSPQWALINPGTPDWQLKTTELHQATGTVLLFWQNTTTGEVSVQIYRGGDAGLVGCHDATSGIPIACQSGAIVN